MVVYEDLYAGDEGFIPTFLLQDDDTLVPFVRNSFQKGRQHLNMPVTYDNTVSKTKQAEREREKWKHARPLQKGVRCLGPCCASWTVLRVLDRAIAVWCTHEELR